jgi:hypothetical protein
MTEIIVIVTAPEYEHWDGEVTDPGMHVQSFYILQVEEQPSPSIKFPSSQARLYSTASPQI